MHRRLSIRSRVALFSAMLAIATGALGVVITLAITRTGLRQNAQATPLGVAGAPQVGTPQPGTVQPGALLPGPLGQLLPGGQLPPGQPGQPDPLATNEGRRAEGGRVNHVIDQSQRRGLLTVAGLAGLAVLAAWFAAGRMLRPIRAMTATARLVATPGSGRRMALVGPSDELHDLADTIDAMLDRLDTSFDAQRRFVADASHELRTPLAVLTTEVDVALDDPNASTSELRASLGRVHHELQGTGRLVESLLHLSRAETQSNTAPYDLATSAEQAIAVAHRLGVGHVRVESSLSTAPVLGDPLLLDRLASNLVENAFRYNIEGGLVHVATSSVAGVSMLVVENDGPLIDELLAQRLFERFRRGAHGSVQRSRTEGHGLGLSIVKTIVATHGGTIELHARRPGGLRIEVRLPSG